VELTATTDKGLQPGQVRILGTDDKKPFPGATVELTTNNEGKHKVLRTRFDDVRSEKKFYFEFVDTDNVVGRRQVRIRPQEDLPPEVNVQVEIVSARKSPQGYMVTPQAQIPFSGVVRDDRGLASIEFLYALTRSDSGELGDRPPLLVAAMQVMAGGMGQNVMGAAWLATVARDAKSDGDGTGKATLRAFTTKLTLRPGENLNWDDVLKLLDEDLSAKNAQRTLLKDFKFDPEDRDLYFDLDPTEDQKQFPDRARLPRSLKAEEGKRQPRYRLQLWLEATDTDILTGPHRGQSKEHFNFVIVPEEELLTEIAKEEENHHVKLEEAVRRLREGEGRLTQMKLDLAEKGGVKKDQFGPMSLRTEEVEQTILEKTSTTVNEVYNDYKRILEELKLNRIKTVNYVKNIEENIVNRLREVIDVDYPEADKLTKELHRLLDLDEADLAKKNTDVRAANDAALAQLTKLIKRLDEVLAAMEKLTNINKLIKMLLDIQDGLGAAEMKYLDAKRDIENRILEAVESQPGDNKPQKKPEKKR
jgi:hypothetical protein